MDDLATRLSLLLNLVLPLVFFMAWIYLALHMLVARIVRQPPEPGPVVLLAW